MTNDTEAEPVHKGINYSFFEWYAHVAHYLYFGTNNLVQNVPPRQRVPLPSGDVKNAAPGSIEAMYNVNMVAEVAAQEIWRRKMVPKKPLDLTDAATLSLWLLGSMGNDLFAKGGDAPARRALREALGLPEG